MMQYNRQEVDYLLLKRELKAGSIRPVYLFCGKEDFLIEEAIKDVITRFLPNGSDDNVCSRMDAQSLPLSEVLCMADTVSLFGKSRLLIVEQAPYFVKGQKVELEDAKRLLSIESDACIIFIATEAYAAMKVVKELAAIGAVYRFEPLKTPALKAWLLQYVAAHGKTISPGVADAFLERAGSQLRTVAIELDKLITYLGHKKEIDEESILAVTVRAFQVDIFALIDAAVYGQTTKALTLLQDLLAAGEPPLRILSMIVRQFRLLGQAREMLAEDEVNLAGALKIHPFAAEKLTQQAKKTNEARIRRAVELLVRCELDIKRGRIQPVLALETLVVALGVSIKNNA